MSIISSKNYYDENRKTRPSGRKRVRQPKKPKIKCSQCREPAVVFMSGRWLCKGHLERHKAKNDAHVPVFTKASNLD